MIYLSGRRALLSRRAILFQNVTVNIVKSKGQRGFTFLPVHCHGEESPDHIQVPVLGQLLIVAPAAGMFIAGRAARIFPRTRFGID
jgi:hypothetical protein